MGNCVASPSWLPDCLGCRERMVGADEVEVGTVDGSDAVADCLGGFDIGSKVGDWTPSLCYSKTRNDPGKA